MSAAAGEERGYSGRILLRVPSSLHAMLVEAAEAEGVSLNQFTMGALAGAVGWRRPSRPSSRRLVGHTNGPDSRSR